MLKNARVAVAFTVSELLKENQQGGVGVKLPKIRVQYFADRLSYPTEQSFLKGIMVHK